MSFWNKRIAAGVVLLGLVTAASGWYLRRETGPSAAYRTAPVKRGSIVVTISSTGTVEPEEVVDVGAQVAGLVKAFGKDRNGRTIDYGTVVEEGTVLAQIDDSLYTADLTQAEAQLRIDQASVVRAKADLQQLKAKLEQARIDVQQSVTRQEQAQAVLRQVRAKGDQAGRNWDRVQKIESTSGAISQTDYETYRTTFEESGANVAANEAAVNLARVSIDSSKSAVQQAEASVAAGESAIVQAEGNVARAQAAADRSRQNLGYCTIKSPVNGVIIDRRVNIGQTVVSTLNAPSLFLIAKDLRRMQVWVAVNEADIGKIKPGLPVTFTVDAFPEETFLGEVGKIRLNASMTQNVVTYIVEITTDNSSGRLLPYLTANVRFNIARADDVLLVPNGALRWTPTLAQVAPEYRPALARQSGGQVPANEGAAPESQPTGRLGRTLGAGIIWAVQDQFVRPIPVRVGLSDGTLTEVTAKEELRAGLEVVIGAGTATAVQEEVNNPFMMKLPPPPGKGGPR